MPSATTRRACACFDVDIGIYVFPYMQSMERLDVKPLVQVFRALADETRVRIVALLTHGELCVCHIEKALAISQPNASRHLGILRMSGLVEARREGTWVYYGLIAQTDAPSERIIAELVKSFGRDAVLERDVERLRKNCGPKDCG
jgi:ArsR family transcriptional regulator, arsenate/arsenite/antimonite-responsive transcriptional repressor